MPQEDTAAHMVIKDLNIQRVKVALKKLESATIRELSRMAGLSPVTVASIIQKLLDEGVALEAALLPSQGGRPSQLYRYDEDRAHALVIFSQEIDGHDHLSLRVTNLYGKVVASNDHLFDFSSLEAFEPSIDEMVGAFPRVRAIGFGLPGVEREGRMVTLDYVSLVGKDFVHHFSGRYGCPVVVENDVNAAVMGHGLREGLTNTEVYLYIPQKYPPGAGIRIKNQVVKGRHGFAGEVSWFPGRRDVVELSSTMKEQEFCEAIAQIVVTLVTVIDPDAVILTGSLLLPNHLPMIQQKCHEALPPWVTPQLELAESFTKDVVAGLTALLLKKIEPEQPTRAWRSPSSGPH